jgi:hypothetical protein
VARRVRSCTTKSQRKDMFVVVDHDHRASASAADQLPCAWVGGRGRRGILGDTSGGASVHLFDTEQRRQASMRYTGTIHTNRKETSTLQNKGG